MGRERKPVEFLSCARKFWNGEILNKPHLYYKVTHWLWNNAAYRDDGDLQRGQVKVSVPVLQKKFSCKFGYRIEIPTDKEIRDVLDWLRKTGEIIVVRDFNNGSLITLVNYDSYTNYNLRISPEYARWRIQVLERDNFTCQQCGQVGGNLHAHHIKSFAKFPDLRFDINNGLTLCIDCHNKTRGKK